MEMEMEEEMWGYLLWGGFGVSASPGRKKLVERDLLSLMEEYNYENSGVDVSLNICTPDPALAIKHCTACQETSTPLWRNGPAGPKTLCNACGIRHRKEMSKINTNLTLGRTPDLQPNAGSAKANKNSRA